VTTPAAEIRSFAVTIPAGTAKVAPVTVDIPFPPRVVTEIHWRVPPGPSGLMGWRLTMSGGQSVLPINGTYIVTDRHADKWAVINQPDSGQWEVTGYNTDIFDHTVYLDFFLSLVGSIETVTTFASNAALSSPPSITTPIPVTIPLAAPPAITIPALVTAPGG
jgi:hypothetical protein